ncbi:hypothetical protein LTR16_009797 [Cryomyces antarcticus]|uniref:Uncharacterized protein n=1 Tax=Cryomyces antarcticus TaxID=329879 RepID=A0ABR0M2F6_9PEZI|nr:hypothetical protein LTR16_009797 [Cryomyces antarcticus]
MTMPTPAEAKEAPAARRKKPPGVTLQDIHAALAEREQMLIDETDSREAAQNETDGEYGNDKSTVDGRPSFHGTGEVIQYTSEVTGSNTQPTVS